MYNENVCSFEFAYDKLTYTLPKLSQAVNIEIQGASWNAATELFLSG